ncbi:unnamed protein product [Brassica napus]|uniref:(rape) hypothetical protein n=1 Tax=Brassica napus TaxID=3708 RepID=A0A816SJD1_BRANA|nr:unnamed protein product [Brassica napus]
MFPKWNGDVDDPAMDNIIKVMFNDPGWEGPWNAGQSPVLQGCEDGSDSSEE